MDLRVQKTRSAIINAFLEIRAVKPLNKITISELAQKAVISKATFYLHYKDIYDLSEKLQDELIADIIKEIPHPEILAEKPETYTNDMITAFLSNQAMIDILFPKSESNNLASKIEYYIRNEIFTHFPHLKSDIKANITLTFLIQGSFYAYQNFSKDNFTEVKKYLSDISKTVINNIIWNS